MLFSEICSYYESRKTLTSESEKIPHKIIGKFPFGIWFRGQGDKNWDLAPKVFRNINNEIIDETNLLYHFRLKYPEYSSNHREIFDWLSLMQHYGTPTRLLDWTESVLTGLFFTVNGKEQNDKDGRLYILDARKLNFMVAGINTIKNNESDSVIIRSFMANTRTNIDFEKHIALKYGQDKILEIRETIESYRKPVAVFPYKLNSRLNSQSGTFVLFGGKVNSYLVQEPIGESIHLKELNSITSDKFLTWVLIKAESKTKIKDELFALGIHEGTLFPELENQSKYLTELWTIKK